MFQNQSFLHRLAIFVFAIMMLAIAIGCEFKKFDHKRAEVSHLRMIGIAAETYKMAYNEYPSSINTQEFQEYLDGESIDDEWGNAVKYELTADGYTVISAGPDKTFGTADDMRLTSDQIENWDEFEIREITN